MCEFTVVSVHLQLEVLMYSCQVIRVVLGINLARTNKGR